VRTGFAGSLYRYVTNTTANNRDRSALTIAYKAFPPRDFIRRDSFRNLGGIRFEA